MYNSFTLRSTKASAATVVVVVGFHYPHFVLQQAMYHGHFAIDQGSWRY